MIYLLSKLGIIRIVSYKHLSEIIIRISVYINPTFYSHNGYLCLVTDCFHSTNDLRIIRITIRIIIHLFPLDSVQVY